MEQQSLSQNIINVLTIIDLIIDITDKLTLELIVIIAILIIVIGYIILLPKLMFIRIITLTAIRVMILININFVIY